MEKYGRMSSHFSLGSGTSSSVMFPSTSAASSTRFLSKPLLPGNRYEKLVCVQPVAADASGKNGSASSRPRRTSRSAASKTSDEKQLFTSTESGNTGFPLNAELASLVIGGGAVLVVAFGVVKLAGKLRALVPMFKLSEAASGSERKFSWESMARLNDFAKELRTFRVVDMSGRKFGDEGFIFVAESLAFNEIVESSDFSANNISAIGIKALSQVLPANSFLKTLNLSGNNIGDEGVKELAVVLEKNFGIEKLILNSTNVGDEGARAIAEMLKKNEKISHLELNNNIIDYSGFAALAEALQTNKTIKVLHLKGNYAGPLGASAFAKGLELNKSIYELHIHGNDIGNEGARTLMQGLMSHKEGTADPAEVLELSEVLEVPEVPKAHEVQEVPEILEAHEVQEVPKLLEAHEPGGIGKLSIGSSSSNEVKTCQVEVIVGGLSFSYCVPSSWRLCQGKEYAGFEVDEVPNTEILESVKSQYPGIEVCWESGVVQLRRSWVRHQVELRGVSVELTVPCSWKLIQSSEYKCAFFAVEEKPGEDLLIQVLQQQKEELEGLEINFLDDIVIVTMPSGGDSDRASYFQKQFECYLARRGMAGKWLFGNSNTLYSYGNYGRRFCPDFTVIDDSLATQARMEQQEQGDTSPVYKDVRLLLAIELQSQTDRMQDVKVKAREMISICADVVICFCAYNDGEVWTFSSGQSDSIVKQPRFLTLDSVAEGLRLYTSCLPSKSWPFNNQQPEMRLMKVSELLETARLAIEHGDGALVEEAINYLDDLNVEYGGLSLLASAATVESVECTQYILTNSALPTVDGDAYVIARSTRNEELCHVFEEYGCCFRDPKRLTLQSIVNEGKKVSRAIGLIKSSPTLKASNEFWSAEDLEDFLSVAGMNNVPPIVSFLLDMGVKPFLEDALQACYEEEVIQLLVIKGNFSEEEKQEIEELSNKLKQGKRERNTARRRSL